MRIKSIDLEKIATALDITPAMHKYALEQLGYVTEALTCNGNDTFSYVQGSFRTGTVVRPIIDGKDADYDLDVVVQINKNKAESDPKLVKQGVGVTLKTNQLLRDIMLPEQDRCWTLEFNKAFGEIGFKMDIVPSVPEDMSYINNLIKKGVPTEYAYEPIAITDKKGENQYDWVESNPSGFGRWFDDINEKFISAVRVKQKENIFAKNRELFSLNESSEDVPEYFLRSSLQRVIQLLKRHRDIYYSRIPNGKRVKPISAIIVSLAAKIASESEQTDLADLLHYVVNGLKDYSVLLKGETPRARFVGEVRTYITKFEKKWIILNPVNPDDNYADSWDDETAKFFFAWIDAVVEDLGDISPINEQRYITGLQTSFGKDFIKHSLEINEPIFHEKLITPTKPWSCGAKNV